MTPSPVTSSRVPPCSKISSSSIASTCRRLPITAAAGRASAQRVKPTTSAKRTANSASRGAASGASRQSVDHRRGEVPRQVGPLPLARRLAEHEFQRTPDDHRQDPSDDRQHRDFLEANTEIDHRVVGELRQHRIDVAIGCRPDRPVAGQRRHPRRGGRPCEGTHEPSPQHDEWAEREADQGEEHQHVALPLLAHHDVTGTTSARRWRRRSASVAGNTRRPGTARGRRRGRRSQRAPPAGPAGRAALRQGLPPR